MVELRGVHRVKAKGRTYYYAWRGGPTLKGEPGTDEFLASYREAIEGRKAPTTDRFNSIVIRYRGSKAYTDLAESTRRNWGPWLDRIIDRFGELRTLQFSRTDKIAPFIRKWRNGFAEKPRAADYGMQVLSRVCAYGVEIGEIASNPCDGTKKLYTTDRSEII